MSVVTDILCDKDDKQYECCYRHTVCDKDDKQYECCYRHTV